MHRVSFVIKSLVITVFIALSLVFIGLLVYFLFFYPERTERSGREIVTVYAEHPNEDGESVPPEIIFVEEPEPTPKPSPVPTPVPTPSPTPAPWEVFRPYSTETSNPENIRGFRFDSRIEGELGPIHFGMPYTYSRIAGITTFRGNNFRDTATWGEPIEVTERRLEERFQFRIGSCCHGRWTGVGWTGQPAIVQWDFQVQQLMNIHPPFRYDPNLVEVIQGAMDGNVYFFCLQTGVHTRPPLRIGVVIKGGVTIDPRGYPLLYVGQGDTYGSLRFGYYIFSLINFEELFFLNGNEPIAPRRWGAFDSNPLFDMVNDRMILCGENGVVYNFLLNTNFNREAGTITIDPVISRYWFHTGRRLGIENSPSALGHYLFFADNSGTIQCLNLLTFEPVWVFEAGDDTDSTMVMEWNEQQQRLFLYTATQVDLQHRNGYSYIRKLDALNGTVLWEHRYFCVYNTAVNGGVTASPYLGRHDIDNLVIFWVAKVIGRGGSGVLVAIDRNTGEIVWETIFPQWGWSSPVAVYTDDGTSYLVVSDSAGRMHLLQGTTGEILYRLNLGGNIEASPAVWGNMIVVGTRGQRVFGIEII